MTKRPVLVIEIAMPGSPVPLVSLRPPQDTLVFYFKRMAMAASSPSGEATPHLLYAAYGYATKEAIIQVRLSFSPFLSPIIEPLFFPRPLLSSPF